MNVCPMTTRAMNMLSVATVMEVSVVSAWKDTQGMATVTALVSCADSIKDLVVGASMRRLTVHAQCVSCHYVVCFDFPTDMHAPADN